MSDSERQQRLGQALEDLRKKRKEQALYWREAEKHGDALCQAGMAMKGHDLDKAWSTFSKVPDRQQIDEILHAIKRLDEEIARLDSLTRG